jgi:hypothetical protein
LLNVRAIESWVRTSIGSRAGNNDEESLPVGPFDRGAAERSTRDIYQRRTSGSGVWRVFALSVADMKASAGWYQKRFGLIAVMQSPKADGGGVTVL